MKERFVNIISTDFSRFLFACGTAAAVNFFSRILLSFYLSYAVSVVVAYIFGIITAYSLCRLFVFTSKKNTPAKEMFYFVLVNGFAILQTLVVSLLLANYALVSAMPDLMLREAAANFVGICVPILSSYFGHKYLSFK